MANIVDVLPVFTPHIDRMRVRDLDSNYHYRWASMSPGRIEFLKTLGYEIVYEKNTQTGEATARTVDNSILMRCPKEMFQKRQGLRQQIAYSRMAAPRQKVVDTGEQLGVEVTDKTREYRGPMSTAVNEKPTRDETQGGEITRPMAETVFNPHLQKEK